MLLQMQNFILLWLWYSIVHARVSVCVCVCIPHLHYPFTCWCMLGLFSCLYCCDTAAVGIGVHICFFELALYFSSDIYPGLGLLVVWLPIFNFLRSLHALFHGAVPICFLTNSIRIPFSPHLCQHLLFVVFMISILTSMGCYLSVVFDLHFSNGWWYSASFQMPIGCLYIFFGKIFIQVFCGVLLFYSSSCL